jgi:ADP-heptose:LPS heptosyltransferase
LNKFLHHIERILKKAADKFIQNNYSPYLITKSEKIFIPESGFKVLLLRHDRLGDVLISTPFLKELRTILNDSRIDIILSFKNKNGKRAIEKYCNNVFILDNKPVKFFRMILEIRRERYDLAVDLLDNASVTSNLILKYSKAKAKLGFDKSNSNNYTHIVPIPDRGSVHIAKRLFALLLPFGHSGIPGKINLEFPLQDYEKEKAAKLLGKKQNKVRLGINLTGSNDSKYWGTENYIQFINEITQTDNVEVVLFAIPRIENKAKFIAAETSCRIAPLQNDFIIYAAMLNECDIILTPDTVAVHLAAAFGKPVIAMFHSPEPHKLMPWYPLGTENKSIVAENGIREINPMEVVNAFRTLKTELDL